MFPLDISWFLKDGKRESISYKGFLVYVRLIQYVMIFKLDMILHFVDL